MVTISEPWTPTLGGVSNDARCGVLGVPNAHMCIVAQTSQTPPEETGACGTLQLSEGAFVWRCDRFYGLGCAGEAPACQAALARVNADCATKGVWRNLGETLVLGPSWAAGSVTTPRWVSLGAASVGQFLLSFDQR